MIPAEAVGFFGRKNPQHAFLGEGGKQWQPTPKKLPRMQCARAIPVA